MSQAPPHPGARRSPTVRTSARSCRVVASGLTASAGSLLARLVPPRTHAFVAVPKTPRGGASRCASDRELLFFGSSISPCASLRGLLGAHVVWVWNLRGWPASDLDKSRHPGQIAPEMAANRVVAMNRPIVFTEAISSPLAPHDFQRTHLSAIFSALPRVNPPVAFQSDTTCLEPAVR
jgi:hypothetical protein